MTTVNKDGRVEFRFFRRDVRDVRVVGDFAMPDGPGGFAMTPGADGWWHATVALAAGVYRFRYVADGVWYTDYASNGIEVARSGVNSLLVIPPAKGQGDRHPAPTDAARMVA